MTATYGKPVPSTRKQIEDRLKAASSAAIDLHEELADIAANLNERTHGFVKVNRAAVIAEVVVFITLEAEEDAEVHPLKLRPQPKEGT